MPLSYQMALLTWASLPGHLSCNSMTLDVQELGGDAGSKPGNGLLHGLMPFSQEFLRSSHGFWGQISAGFVPLGLHVRILDALPPRFVQLTPLDACRSHPFTLSSVTP